MSDKVTLNVSGMTCAACVRRIEEGLSQTPGVLKATVNFATEKAQVEYDKNIVDIKALQSKVHDLGYEAFRIIPGTQHLINDINNTGFPIHPARVTSRALE